MNIAFRFAARSDVGMVRSKNDDSAYAGHYLAIVADGMGGHVGGDVASATTVLDLTPLDRTGYSGSAGIYLADEIQTANMIMNELVSLNPALGGMGTTCTALLIDGGRIELAHIGDSRAYRLRDGNFEQITTDHTFVQRLLSEGRITREEAENHPHKNVIMRVLGDVDASPELELQTLDAQVGEKWLLSSDGLDNCVSLEEIEAVLRSTSDLKQIVDTLTDLTLQRGAPDNVTLVALQVIAEDTLSQAITAPQPIIPVRKYDDSGTHVGVHPVPAEDIIDVDAAEQASEYHHKIPWRRRLPSDAKLRNALRHGKWRGESFSDGVLNVMTQTAGVDERPVNAEESSASVLRTELKERPHQLVGSAANATQTGKIPAVAERTVQQRATLAQTATLQSQEKTAELPEDFRALLEGEDNEDPRPRWAVRIFAAILTLAVLAATVWSGLSWISNRYYVGVNNNKVAIYSGVPQSVGPIHLYELLDETSIEVDTLPEYSQSLLHNTITATDRQDAERIVDNLNQQVIRRAPTPGTVTTVMPEPSASAPSEPKAPETQTTDAGVRSETTQGGQ
ncbi:PP2C family serine/threonine-protein phosphatase [Rothia sp. ZJ932]|uniref:PP2C family protein-serine/threonine phosphatase n=1 Tax=Rothia sp. ZJ932 TaxID=2810516 RepID=UPI001967F852|nr:PP2C family serine/threonine-protein phosphatase [Rothia sp. ZJ932]QRZ61524.1 serine/threonine-protein phosphatase [Rothia sp. ZJ932]